MIILLLRGSVTEQFKEFIHTLMSNVAHTFKPTISLTKTSNLLSINKIKGQSIHFNKIKLII